MSVGRANVAFGLAALAALGCSRAEPPPPSASSAPEDHAALCFETHDRTSSAASAVFEKRNLQGGGPTWAAVLQVVVRRHGAVGAGWTRPSPVGFGAAYDVTFRGEQTWYLVDDEAEGAIFCTGAPSFLRAVSDEFAALNRDPSSLERALDQADPNALE